MGDEPEERAPNTAQRTEQHHSTEFAATILLALSSVVTSWSGYQASLWSGIQSTNYNQANALRVESARESTQAGQQVGLDVALFMAWVNAKALSNDRLAEFYNQRFRPEFRQLFDASHAIWKRNRKHCLRLATTQTTSLTPTCWALCCWQRFCSSAVLFSNSGGLGSGSSFLVWHYFCSCLAYRGSWCCRWLPKAPRVALRT